MARGTGKLHDVLTDLACAAAPHRDGGHAHGGMLEAAKRLREDVMGPVRDALVNRPGFSFVLCGHSLGGGVATLLADLLGPEIEVAGRRVPVRCFSYAPPAVLSIELVRWSGFAAAIVLSLWRASECTKQRMRARAGGPTGAGGGRGRGGFAALTRYCSDV